MICEFPTGAGWTIYPPLSTSLMSLSPVNIDIIIDSLLIAGISSFLSSLNFMVTINNMRLLGLIINCMPLFTWSILITALLLLMTLPILTGALGMLLLDIHFNTLYFDSNFGGDPVLYQHFFWFFGHPEVYILIIPAFGIISIVIKCNMVSVNVFIFGFTPFVISESILFISIFWGLIHFISSPFFNFQESTNPNEISPLHIFIHLV
jgi:heme/copper-type cytochrome/quinol oxidase subunit 1